MNNEYIISDKSHIDEIANAVREQTGEADLMSINEIPSKIRSLSKSQVDPEILETKKNKDIIVTYQEGSNFNVTHSTQQIQDAVNEGTTVYFKKDAELLDLLEVTPDYATFYMTYVNMEGKLQQKIVVIGGSSIMLEQDDTYDYATIENVTDEINKFSTTTISSTYETITDSQSKLSEAKSYTDTKIADLASNSSVNTAISTHNTSVESHTDIRTLINDLSTEVNNFLDVDDDTKDQLSEVLTLIENNKGTLESLTTTKINVSDIVNNLTTNSADKVLSAAQGVAIKGLIDGKADKDHGTHVEYSTALPEIDGTASVGTATTVARSDHKHPTDTSRAAQTSLDSHTDNKNNPHGVTLSQLGVTASAAELNYVDGVTSNIQTQLNKKLSDYSIELYNGTSGNPKPVRFASFNYSTCNSENGISAKIGMVSGHGNGSSYAFLQDVIIKVNHLGGVSVDNFKYYGTTTGTYDGAARQYGDIFWLVDETNKIIDFYVLMGQYARVNMTPWKRLTHSTGGTVTQHTSCTVYSSGTKNWGNNDMFALKSDISNLQAQIDALTASAIAVLSGPSEPTAEMGDDGDIYIITE